MAEGTVKVLNPASPEWEPPAEFDDYQLVHRLGAGRMGLVYLAHDRVLARHVAVKFVKALVPSAAARIRFLTEARAAARLQHPNVVAVYRVGELDLHPYLVSEFVRGQTLDRMVKPLVWKRGLEIGIGLARGLAAAHRGGVLHRDLKPSNAILADDGQAKLLDFGLAKLDQTQAKAPSEPARDAGPERAGAQTLDVDDPEPSPVLPVLRTLGADGASRHDSAAFLVASEQGDRASTPLDEMPLEGGRFLTRVGGVVGTPDYIAPEMWQGGPATRQSDVYAFGALLFELLSGTVPYGSCRVDDLPSVVLSQDPPPLLSLVPGVEPRLCAIVDRCLSRRLDERYASGDAVREALEDLSRIADGPSAPAGNPYRGLRAFDADHRAFFFGREDEVGIVLERLRSEPFVLLAGDSGVGKSSICHAGVIPRVLGHGLEGGRAWSSVTITAGRHPVAALAQGLAPLLGVREEELAVKLHGAAESVFRDLRLVLGDDRGLVLFVDQLEELVTQSAPEEAAVFDEFLGRLATGAPGLRLLCTVRADLLTRLAVLPRLGTELSRALYLVRPIGPEKLRDVVEGPARATGVRFESESLVEALVDAARLADGGLPLLQFTLAALWEARDRTAGVLTSASLAAMGGVAGALARHADLVLATLRPAQRVAARRMLQRLVTLEGTRARRTEAELTGGDAVARAALDALLRGRLLVAHESSQGSAYEVAHEALLSGWPTLREWLREDADRRVVIERLARAAAEWLRLDRGPDALLRGRQLREAQVVGLDELSPDEAAFLERSRHRARRTLLLRWSLIVGLPLIVGTVLVVSEVVARRDVRERIDQRLGEARTAHSLARTVNGEVEALRRRAFTLFDAGKRDLGQEAWAQALVKSRAVAVSYGEVSHALEAALVLDSTRIDVRSMFALTLFEWATVAERDGQIDRGDELLHRLSIYDDNGEYRDQWKAPAEVRLTVDPPGARLAVQRYVPVEGRLEAQSMGGASRSATAAPLVLAPGSYRLSFTAPGRAQVFYPLLVSRGERLAVRVELPLSERVPSGYVYVPQGRFLFGSSADEDVQRGFFDTVPLHEVQIGAYLIGQYEVTVGEWIEFLSQLSPEERDRRRPHLEGNTINGAAVALEVLPGNRWQFRVQPASRSYTALQGERIHYAGRLRRREQDWLRFPVTAISADDARVYVAWLASSGRLPGARLCTEYEWERAARGADDRRYPHGQTLLPDDANHDQTYARNQEGIGPDEVGSHPASRSPFGVDDLAGNAFEWTTSSLVSGHYVGRGGSYFYDTKTNQIPNRQVSMSSLRDLSVGLRVCATVAP